MQHQNILSLLKNSIIFDIPVKKDLLCDMCSILYKGEVIPPLSSDKEEDDEAGDLASLYWFSF